MEAWKSVRCLTGIRLLIRYIKSVLLLKRKFYHNNEDVENNVEKWKKEAQNECKYKVENFETYETPTIKFIQLCKFIDCFPFFPI